MRGLSGHGHQGTLKVPRYVKKTRPPGCCSHISHMEFNAAAHAAPKALQRPAWKPTWQRAQEVMEHDLQRSFPLILRSAAMFIEEW